MFFNIILIPAAAVKTGPQEKRKNGRMKEVQKPRDDGKPEEQKNGKLKNRAPWRGINIFFCLKKQRYQLAVRAAPRGLDLLAQVGQVVGQPGLGHLGAVLTIGLTNIPHYYKDKRRVATFIDDQVRRFVRLSQLAKRLSLPVYIPYDFLQIRAVQLFHFLLPIRLKAKYSPEKYIIILQTIQQLKH